MFDVSFSELMVIGVVALVVIGPERLPRVAPTAGHLLGRLQRYVSDVKADINREIQLEDLKKFQQQMTEQAQEIKSSFASTVDSTAGELRELDATLQQSIAPPSESAAVPPPLPVDGTVRHDDSPLDVSPAPALCIPAETLAPGATTALPDKT